VPGFGPKLLERLITWRDTVAKGFKFDPARGVPPQAIAALMRKYDGLRASAADRLRRGSSELERLTSEATQSFTRSHDALDKLVQNLARAEADLSVFR
jgi:DNA-binding helix-hairpin-helix protein with protein kinase domain